MRNYSEPKDGYSKPSNSYTYSEPSSSVSNVSPFSSREDQSYGSNSSSNARSGWHLGAPRGGRY